MKTNKKTLKKIDELQTKLLVYNLPISENPFVDVAKKIVTETKIPGAETKSFQSSVMEIDNAWYISITILYKEKGEI